MAHRPSVRRARAGLAGAAGVMIAAFAVLLLATGAGAAAPAAGSDAPLLAVRAVDSTGKTVAVTFTYGGPAADVASLRLTEDGKPVTTTPAKPLTAVTTATGQLGNATVLVVDASATTGTGLLDDFRKAVAAFTAHAKPGDQLALVSTGQLSSVRQGLTGDPAIIQNAMNGVTAEGEGGLWAGVQSAIDVLSERGDLNPSIVILTDGNVGGIGPDVRANLIDSGAAVYAYGVQTGKLDAPTLQDLTGITHGQYAQSKSISGAAGPVGEFGAVVAATYRTTYASTVTRGVTDLHLTVGSSSTSASYVAGSLQVGSAALALQKTVKPNHFLHIGALSGDAGKMIGLIAGVLAAALAAYAIALVAVRDNSRLSAFLRPYSDGFTGGSDPEEEAEEKGSAQTAFIQRAVQITGQFAERQGLLTKIEIALERANLPLRAAEALFFYVAGVGLLTLLVGAITRSILIALITIGVAILLPPAVLNYLANRRRKQFNAQLPDMLQLLSGTLRAGYSMMQGVEAVSQEAVDPMGRELRRVVTEARLGRPLEESLDAVGERMDSRDFEWAVMAIRIQREVGGNLSELLLTVAETMRQRERLRREVRALTAEGRVSAIVLGILPVALGFVMYAINPDYMRALFEEGVGKLMLLGACVLAGVGFWWMKKTIEIDI